MAIDLQRIFRKRDRLRQLRAFCRAAELESITRSAEHLSISQPMVSLHIRELEHEVEALLFDRIGPRVALTSAGECLYRLAMPLLESMDHLTATVAPSLGESMGGEREVRLAAGPSGVAFVLPSILKRFRDENPRVELHVRQSPVQRALELLSSREVDFVVGAGGTDTDTDAFSYHAAFSYDFVLITPEGHPLASRTSVDIEEAASYPAVVPPAGTYNRRCADSIACRFGVELNVAVEASGWGVVKRCVEGGIGISVVPGVCLDEGDRVWVVPFDRYVPSRSYGVFIRRGQPLTRPAGRLIRMMAPDFPDSD